ncbi:MAG TPA: tRNA-dihydrouridine synthase family protein, partial [Nitrospirota bacterium]
MLNIGNVNIDGKTALAPLAGITDLPFRLVCKGLGAALVYSEMISSEGLVRYQSKTLSITNTGPAERPVSFQLFGSNPDSMARGAAACTELGADLVDINMGCPVKKVVKGRSGSALLKDLGHSMDIIRAVVAASGVPVTIKIRTGWSADDFVAVELAQAAE